MTSYFFDTNILFKIFFNRAYLDECDLKDYLNNDLNKYISKNVEYEFSNIFLDFTNQFNHLLIGSYYQLDNLNDNIHLKDFQKLTGDCEVLKYNNAVVSSMIWKTVCGNKKSILKDDFKKALNDFIFDFNHYFHFKYYQLLGGMTIHGRLNHYEDLENLLKPYIHDSDIRICLDAHDIAVKNNLDDLVFVSADNVFFNNCELIVENTQINEIRRI